jgi:hypothetical protein
MHPHSLPLSRRRGEQCTLSPLGCERTRSIPRPNHHNFDTAHHGRLGQRYLHWPGHNRVQRILLQLVAEVKIMSWQDRITIDPNVLVGKPVIKGTRISVEFVIDLLARGMAGACRGSGHGLS